MATAMFASVFSLDGRWSSVRISPCGVSTGSIPGTFETKAQADENARRYLGSSK